MKFINFVVLLNIRNKGFLLYFKRWKSIFVGVDAEVAHTKGNVNIVISSDLDEAPDNESFGVRDFFLYIARCAKACDICLGPNESDCTSKKCFNHFIRMQK